MVETKIQAITIDEQGVFTIHKDWENTLEKMQQHVGGYIEAFTLTFDDVTERRITAWLNDEGKLIGLEPTLVIVGSDEEVIDVLVGNLLITCTDHEGETVGLTDEEVHLFLDKLGMAYDKGGNGVRCFFTDCY